MSTNVIMPQMGESIVEGTITKWLKSVGDAIVRDESLFEITTDKVDSEIPSPASGILKEILVQEGETVQINTVVAVIVEEDSVPAEKPPDAAVPSEEPEPVVEKTEGSDADASPPAVAVTTPEEPKAEPAAEAEADVPTAAQPKSIRTSPLVRRLAREHGIDLTTIEGSGLSGRITKRDILGYLERQADTAVPSAPPEESVVHDASPAASVQAAETPKEVSAAAEPTEPVAGDTETVPMTTMRKAIAEHMVSSRRISAHVHTVFQVDMTAIAGLRRDHKNEFEAREGISLTYTPFFVKGLVDTVREFPILNCSVSGDSIVYKKPINVGVAVALETGLIVPVVKNAHLKSFTGIALAIHDLADRARNKKLIPDDVQQGTITITNPGVYGSLFATPIINQPQVAILGVGGIQKRPVVINDAIAIRPIVHLTLSFDHRVIDGAVADQSMAALKARLESWSQWID
jgi:2-oxoglutarate dehydrogenase E2 component (dihydrolipoamide succinyltransferase)